MASLKLIALDIEDLQIMSAYVQDAVGKIADMAYLPHERRFVAILNRFDGAAAGSAADKQGIRHQSALRIERVLAAKVQGIDLKAKDTILALLAVAFEPDSDAVKAPAGVITLVCAGDAAIRLEVECIEAGLEDLGPSWSAGRRPDHTSAAKSGEAARKDDR